jgi:hypothetical protein
VRTNDAPRTLVIDWRTINHPRMSSAPSRVKDASVRADTSVVDVVDVERVLDPRVNGLLRGQTIKVRGMKVRLENKLWKLAVLFMLWAAVWLAQTHAAARGNAWAAADPRAQRQIGRRYGEGKMTIVRG